MDNGTGTKIIALTNDIGAVTSLKVNDSGFNYDSNDLPDMRFRSHFVLKDVTGTFLAANTFTTHTGTVKDYNATTQQLGCTFEDIIKFNMEQSGTYNLRMIIEDGDSANNENNISMEETQIVDTTDNDNIVLDGTSITSAPQRLVEVDVKVVTNSDLTNSFWVNSVKQRDLILTEGFTYNFDLSDSSLYNEVSTSNHPFRFSTTSDGTHGGGTEYTSGVTKSEITVPM